MKFLIPFLMIPVILCAAKISIIGDSISVGESSRNGRGYVDELITRYKEEGKDVEIINRSYCGACTDTALQIAIHTITVDRPDYVVFFLGINDCGKAMHFGLTPVQLQQEIIHNLYEAVKRSTLNCKRVIIGGLNCAFYPAYNESMIGVYQFLITHYNCYPVMLLGQDVIAHTYDGFHPNDVGSKMIADKLYIVFHELGLHN